MPAAGPDVPLRPRKHADDASRSGRSTSRSRSRRRSRSTASAASSATAARASREEVAEDGQLVALNRGAASMIATFEDTPYRGHFSGNVIELCPVGALTSTQYRFEARPWEIQNVPTVCGLCPVGCNIHATTREGKVKRILSRNHPEVDEGWLCDKGRFAFSHLRARDRVAEPLRRLGRAPASSRSRGTTALDRGRGAAAHRRARASSRRSPASSRSSRRGRSAKLLRVGLGAHAAVLPEEAADVARRVRAAALGDPRRRARRRRRRRAGRRARADRRPLAEGRAAEAAPRSSSSGLALESPAEVCRCAARHRARRAAARERAGDRDLVGRRPRGLPRGARGRARPRGQARLGRLLPAAHAERPRRHRRLGRGRRRRARRRRSRCC